MRRFFRPLATIITLILAPVLATEKIVLSGPENHPTAELAYQILSRAYARLDIEVERVTLPVARSLAMANEGEVDGEMFRGDRIEANYPNLLRVPVLIDTGGLSVFVKSPTVRVRDWKDLQPYSIGSQIGLKAVEQSTAGMQTTFATEPEQVMQLLLHDRVDLVLLPTEIGYIAMHTLIQKDPRYEDEVAEVYVLQPPLEQGKLYHYLHAKNSGLLPRITSVLVEMQASGELDELRKRHLQKLQGKAAPAVLNYLEAP